MAVVRGVGAEADAGLDRACCGRVRLRDLQPAYLGMPRARVRAQICIDRASRCGRTRC
jgi:hypothetical protein